MKREREEGEEEEEEEVFSGAVHAVQQVQQQPQPQSQPQSQPQQIIQQTQARNNHHENNGNNVVVKTESSESKTPVNHSGSNSSIERPSKIMKTNHQQQQQISEQQTSASEKLSLVKSNESIKHFASDKMNVDFPTNSNQKQNNNNNQNNNQNNFYNQQQFQIQHQQVYGSSSNSYLILSQSQDRIAKIQVLVDLNANLPVQEIQFLESLSNLLISQLPLLFDTQIKKLSLRLLKRLALIPQLGNLNSIVKILISVARNSNENEICCEVIRTLRNIAKSRPSIKNNLYLESLHFIISKNSSVRSEAALLLATCAPSSKSVEAQSLLTEMINGKERSICLSAFLILHNSHPLSHHLYSKVVGIMRDIEESVRLESLKLVWLLSNLHPNVSISNQANMERLLRDDSFSNICVSVTDTSVPVRTKACKMLGWYRDVERKTLLETISKEVMYGSNKGKLQVGRQTKDQSKSKDQSRTEVEGDFLIVESSSLESGAVGVFVNGLEDEFEQVRMATVDTMCELSLSDQDFSYRSIDFLVDMLSDEIVDVRINSLSSLLKLLSTNVSLNLIQLQMVLSCLEDSSNEVREAAHQVMRQSSFMNINSLQASILSLLSNLSHFPQDRESIEKAMKGIGERNYVFSEFIVDSLLRLDRRFMTPQPHIDDPVYVCGVIEVLNAAVKNPTIISLLPKFVLKHYPYFRSKFPRLIPHLFLEDQDEKNDQLEEFELKDQKSTNGNDLIIRKNKDNNNNNNIESKDISELMKEIVGSVFKLSLLLKNEEFDLLNGEMNLICSRLKRIKNLSQVFAANVELLLMVLECLREFVEYKRNSHQLAREAASRLLQTCYLASKSFRLAFVFELVLMELRLCAHIFLAVSVMSDPFSPDQSVEQQQLLRDRLFSSFAERVGVVVRYCERMELELPESVKELVGGDSKPNEDPTPRFFRFMKTFVPQIPLVHSITKRSTAQILAPVVSDKPIEFNPFFPLEIQLRAKLSNVIDCSKLMIKLVAVINNSSNGTTPVQQTQSKSNHNNQQQSAQQQHQHQHHHTYQQAYFQLEATNFISTIGQNDVELNCKINPKISWFQNLNSTSDTIEMRIEIVSVFELEIPDFDSQFLRNSSKIGCWKSPQNNQLMGIISLLQTPHKLFYSPSLKRQ